MSGADPRVAQSNGPYPNREAVTELAERVHQQLDLLGVPRFVEAGRLTLLGRMAEWLDADAGTVKDTRPPVIGEMWGRGPRPTGSRAQVEAWLRALDGSPHWGVVISADGHDCGFDSNVSRPGEVLVYGFGAHDEDAPGTRALRRYPLEAFTAKWWRV